MAEENSKKEGTLLTDLEQERFPISILIGVVAALAVLQHFVLPPEMAGHLTTFLRL